MKTSRAFTHLAAFALAAAAPHQTFAGIAEGPRIVAKVGGPVPDLAGATFTGFDQPVIDDGGNVAFKGTFTGGGATAATDGGIFVGPPSAPTMRVREGVTPVGPSMLVPEGVEPGLPPPNDNVVGEVSLIRGIQVFTEVFFSGTATGTGITFNNDRAIYRAPVPAMVVAPVDVVVREGDSLGGGLTIAANGLESGNVVPGVLASSGGHVALTAQVADAAAPGVTKHAVIYSNAMGQVFVIGLTGGLAPGGGTFQGEFAGQNPFEVSSVGPNGIVTFRGKGVESGEPFEAIFLYYPETGVLTRFVAWGDKAQGAKPGRVLSNFGVVSATGGGTVIFDSVLQKGNQPPDFSEIGLFQTTGLPGKVKLIALRDRPAKATGGVFSAFSSCFINQTGCVAFGAFLFKRPNGFPAGQDQAVFGGPGKPQLIAQSGKSVPGLPGTTCTSFDFDGISLTSGNQVLIPATVEPGDSALLVSTFDGPGKPDTEILLQEGQTVETGAGPDTLNAFDLPNGPSKGSDGKPRSVNAFGQGVFEVVFATNGNCVFFTGTPKLPPAEPKPDIVYSPPDAAAIGDDVHQDKPDVPQKIEREQLVNVRVNYTFTIQNDSTEQDMIRFTSSGSDARDRLKWYLGNDDTMEISDAVFGDGQTFTLEANQRVTVRLAADRQTLENKGKTDKVKMKAVSTADKQFRDAFQITIKFTPAP